MSAGQGTLGSRVPVAGAFDASRAGGTQSERGRNQSANPTLGDAGFRGGPVPVSGVGRAHHPPRLGVWVASLAEDLLGLQQHDDARVWNANLRPLAGPMVALISFVMLLGLNAWVRTEFVQVTRNIDTQTRAIQRAASRNAELSLEISTRSGNAAMDAAIRQWGLVPAQVERARSGP